MRLLASIRPRDVDPESPEFDYAKFTPRPAGRAVLFDGNKVALIHVSKHGYYMLPGGGVDEDETMPAALAREVMEEIGCDATIGQEVGSVAVCFDRWQQKQIDYCYTARKTGAERVTALVPFEKAAGYQTVWAENISVAVKLVEDAAPTERDGKLVRARDLLFLKTVAAQQQASRLHKGK